MFSKHRRVVHALYINCKKVLSPNFSSPHFWLILSASFIGVFRECFFFSKPIKSCKLLGVQSADCFKEYQKSRKKLKQIKVTKQSINNRMFKDLLLVFCAA